MSRPAVSNTSYLVRSLLLIATIIGVGAILAAWKHTSIEDANAAMASQPEPMESVTAAVASERDYRETTTSIGTVLALRSVTLRNEVSGTVRDVMLVPGEIVDAGTVLVALDIAVEEAELQAQEAQAHLAETVLARLERLILENAAAQVDVDRAVAQRDVAVADIARTKAIIARKTIRAPFRARVGISDVHQGQYLSEGTLLTTLQGVDPFVNVDFAVAQRVAAGLREGDTVDVFTSDEGQPLHARIVAIDARVDPVTRNASVRARMVRGAAPAPGASVRVVVRTGPARSVVVVPVSALLKGPAGDQIFVIVTDGSGKTRVQSRPVQSGPILGDDVVILAGVSAGEQVAATGSFKLHENALVAIADPSPREPNVSQ